MSHNVHLLYALMHDSLTVEPLFAHPAVRVALEHQELSGALGQRVLGTTQHYLALLEVKVGANNDSPLTAAQVRPLVHVAKIYSFLISCTFPFLSLFHLY